MRQDSRPSRSGGRLPWTARVLCGGLLAILPLQLFALGLGEASVASALNEPLSVSIPLILNAGEGESVEARLASRAKYERRGLPYASFLGGLRVEVVQREGTEPRIELSTRLPVSELVLDFVLEVRSARGGWMQRVYVLLLDPRPETSVSERGEPPPAPVGNANPPSR